MNEKREFWRRKVLFHYGWNYIWKLGQSFEKIDCVPNWLCLNEFLKNPYYFLHTTKKIRSCPEVTLPKSKMKTIHAKILKLAETDWMAVTSTCQWCLSRTRSHQVTHIKVKRTIGIEQEGVARRLARWH